METKQINGTVKWTTAGELVAEISFDPFLALKSGTAVEVAGVIGTVKKVGARFKVGRFARVYVYLIDATGAIPAKADRDREPCDGGQNELRNAII